MGLPITPNACSEWSISKKQWFETTCLNLPTVLMGTLIIAPQNENDWTCEWAEPSTMLEQDKNVCMGREIRNAGLSQQLGQSEFLPTITISLLSNMGERMALAQGLILFGVEGLSFQVDLADLWREGILSEVNIRSTLMFDCSTKHGCFFVASSQCPLPRFTLAFVTY